MADSDDEPSFGYDDPYEKGLGACTRLCSGRSAQGMSIDVLLPRRQPINDSLQTSQFIHRHLTGVFLGFSLIGRASLPRFVATPSSLVTSPRPSYSFPGRNDAPVPTVTDIGMPQTTGAFHATANRKVALGVERYTAACLVQQQPTPSCGSPSAPKTSPQSYLTLTAVNGSSTSVKSSGRHPYSYDFLRSRVMMWAGNTIGKLNVER